MRHRNRVILAGTILFCTNTVTLGQVSEKLKTLQEAVSAAEIETTLQGLNYDRTSGKEGEQRAFAYLQQRLSDYGVKHTRYDMRAFLSWPISARVSLSHLDVTFRAVTAAFGASTPVGGLSAEAVWLSRDGSIDDVKGKILIVPGMVSPQSALRAQRAGAAGLIHVNETDTLHEMIATTIWGTPTTESAERLPTIPIASIGTSDGDRLKAAAASAKIMVHLFTEVERGWGTIPLLTADVPGASADFIMVATHVDAWFRGMTDTAGTVASILEMARILQRHQRNLARGIRFAWWSGHSFGRYPGSTWYADRFWRELDEHGVAYTNLDGAGRRGSRKDDIYARGWPGMGEYSRKFAKTLTGRSIPKPDRLFRPGRDSDSSFQGIGMPHFAVGVPGPPRGHPDVQPSGRIDYWHTDRDTLDKLDMEALALDTRYRVAQLYDLATRPVLPHRIEPIAESFIRALEQLAAAAGAAFDLSSTQSESEELRKVARQLDQLPRPSDPEAVAALNGLLLRQTHRLNAALYTRAGRFDQDPAAPIPILPLLARVRELAALDPESDLHGFLETELIRGRNEVDAVLREARREIQTFLANR